MSTKAKYEALNGLNKENASVIIFWFDESQRKAETLAGGTSNNFIQARDIHSHLIKNKEVIFAEHYPLSKKEQELFETLQLTSVVIYSALDEPLFINFGGESIIRVMQKLGILENESVEHTMISKSIRNAQQKLEKKISFEQAAHSAEDWFTKNK